MRWKKKAGLLAILALCCGIVIGFSIARHFPAPGVPRGVRPPMVHRGDAFPRRLKAVDAALRDSFAAVGMKPADVRSSVERRRHAGRFFDFRILRLPQCDRDELRRSIEAAFAKGVPRARLSQPSTREWGVYLDGVETHRLLLPALPATPPPSPGPKSIRQPSSPKRSRGEIALVIDDMGENVAFARSLAALDVPVAFSIWPDSSKRDAVLGIARAHHREILVHLPMQPQRYPQIDPGKHALLLNMNADEIRAATLRAIRLVPGAIGVNNHEGSAFTENAPAMRAALGAMRSRGMFFLDSKTTPHSVAARIAARLGLRCYRRDVFLDNVQSPSAVMRQLRQAEAIARKRGRAVVIGHPHPATLAALREWLKTRDSSVRLVPLTALRAK